MKSFAVESGRYNKALKVNAVLCSELNNEDISGYSILDIGSGSGHIAAFFATKNEVIAADVTNQISVDNLDLSFVKISQNQLPFEDSSFDIVILNQVLTYIPDQLSELKEVRRVLKVNGVCYVSLPNRMYPIEPHSKIPFIHYFPIKIYQLLLNLITAEECEVKIHTFKGMINLFEEANFLPTDYTVEILSNPQKYQTKLFFKFPFWKWISHISPTNIFILRPQCKL